MVLITCVGRRGIASLRAVNQQDVWTLKSGKDYMKN